VSVPIVWTRRELTDRLVWKTSSTTRPDVSGVSQKPPDGAAPVRERVADRGILDRLRTAAEVGVQGLLVVLVLLDLLGRDVLDDATRRQREELGSVLHQQGLRFRRAASAKRACFVSISLMVGERVASDHLPSS
jgi:hypothetical protein